MQSRQIGSQKSPPPSMPPFGIVGVPRSPVCSSPLRRWLPRSRRRARRQCRTAAWTAVGTSEIRFAYFAFGLTTEGSALRGNPGGGEEWRYEQTAASTSGGWSHSGKNRFPEAAPTRACRRTPSPPPQEQHHLGSVP